MCVWIVGVAAIVLAPSCETFKMMAASTYPYALRPKRHSSIDYSLILCDDGDGSDVHFHAATHYDFITRHRYPPVRCQLDKKLERSNKSYDTVKRLQTSLHISQPL